MSAPRAPRGEDLRGASRLAVDATESVMALVEELHRTIASGPSVLGRPLEGPARAITGLVYGTLRGATRLVGSGLDVALRELTPYLGDAASGPERDAVLAALNGVLGDYLAATGNPLALQTELRRGGRVLDVNALGSDARRRVLVLVHGLCMHDGQWTLDGHDHGAALAHDLGYAAVYARYNSGLHVHENGRELSTAIAQLMETWPVPVEEIAVLGHSMGGLVARSACHAAETEGAAWRSKLTRLVTLGTPHHGALLERGGSWLHALLGVSRYSAPFARLARLRSAGVTDLRFGAVLPDADRSRGGARDRFALGGDRRAPLPLPSGVRAFAVAGSLSPRAATTSEGALRLRGDGLVTVRSALGVHDDPRHVLAFPDEARRVVSATGHLDLLKSREVYEALATWLA